MRVRYFTILLALIIVGCGGNTQREESAAPEQPVVSINVPPFNADSAYAFVAQPVAVGPRTPNTAAHRQAAAYFVSTLRSYGAQVNVQEFQARIFTGQQLRFKNIIASFTPQATKRILLAAHWDTRP